MPRSRSGAKARYSIRTCLEPPETSPGKGSMSVTRTAVFLICLLAGSVRAYVFAQAPATLAPAAQPQATLSPAEQETFLLNARIVSTRAANKGVTDTQRATLSDGRITHD